MAANDEERTDKTFEDVASAKTDIAATAIDESGERYRRDAPEDARPYVTPDPAHSLPKNIGDPDQELVVFANAERYEVRRQLGEGGMGEVHLCRDRMIGREVAMKVVLGTHRRRDELQHRFVREARVQGQLEHPAIVPVYDFGVDTEGRAFFTMRRVRGVTLEEILERLHRNDAETARTYTRHKLLAAFVRVCLAIDFAHEHGVVHRDLKPGNVMLGRHGEVYVLDWGVAKVRSASRSLDHLRVGVPLAEGEDPRPSERHELSGVGGGETAHGAVLGTPQYMAPEQIKGEDIDARADVYALGAILFELLTLEPLHGAGTLSAVLARALRGVEARPSIRSPHRDVPPELEQACVRATKLARSERYVSARRLADAVEAYLNGDRDLELRRELAKEHLARAREAAGKAETSLADRSVALSEIGRSLALAPDDPDALGMLVGLLTTPPLARVNEVDERVERAAQASRRKMLPRAAIAYGATALAFLPLEMLFGARDPRLAALPLALWLLTAVFALAAWRGGKERATYPAMTFAASAALAATSLLHGPLIVVPAAGAVMAVGMSLQTPRRQRSALIALNALAVGIPTLLAWLDLHPVRHTFPNGDLLLSGGLVTFSRASLALVGLLHVAVIVVGGVFVGAYREELRVLQTRLQLQAWQLEQLVPRAAIEPVLPKKR
jgi:eukaryotic-like serine/threonine-protein kinase